MDENKKQERTQSQDFSADESQKNRDFNQSERTASEAFQSKEAAKSRAQNFMAQKMMNNSGSFSEAKDYTGGASSIGQGRFNPSGKSREKMDYSFKMR